MNDFDADLEWIREQMPLTRRALAALPTLEGVRLACSMHLERKMIPALEGLLARGAQIFLTTCNPATVDDQVVDRCVALGASAEARHGMSDDAWQGSFDRALDFAPTHLCEMGAALSLAALERPEVAAGIRASLEATGSGITRLGGRALPYPVFNWDDVPIKEGLHNRRLVGLMACQSFLQHTRLSFHNKRVLVVGHGLVGRGVADAALAFGGRVSVAERDPARALEARFAGLDVVELSEFLPRADVVITATGVAGVIGPNELARVKEGAFLINVGHASSEIDVPYLRSLGSRLIRPHLERIELAGRSIYLFASGSMANLSAGQGDSLNAFDVTLAVLVAGIGFLCSAGPSFSPGLHLLPRDVWLPVARAGLE